MISNFIQIGGASAMVLALILAYGTLFTREKGIIKLTDQVKTGTPQYDRLLRVAWNLCYLRIGLFALTALLIAIILF